MKVRQPARAGQFYEGSPGPCRHHVTKLLDGVELPQDLPKPLYGGLVPHAGWSYSGALAARTLKALSVAGAPATFVLFGADHVGTVRQGEVFDSGVWRTPLGDVAVDEELAREMLAAAPACLRSNPSAHAEEHSLEVQVPLIQVLAEEAKVLPIAVPPAEVALEIGRAVGRVLAGRSSRAAVVGSTDLTHHGGHFGNWGGQRSEKGVRWTEDNDRRILAIIERMDAEAILPEVRRHQNACGAGAIAAAIAACRELGATRGICMEYTNSYRVVHDKYPYELDDTTVGYAAVVFA